MRRFGVLVVAASTLSCSTPQDLSQQFTQPAPMPPTMRAPICARPSEKTAIEASAVVSQLQLITMSCGTRDRYNALIPRLRPALATKEQNLSAFFKRAYGKRGQTEHDKYITELANLQSEFALKSGDRFCTINAGIFDQVMPLSTVDQLARYAQSKPIQQALAVDECGTAAAPKTKPRVKGQQRASR
jgi:hypothetical protein